MAAGGSIECPICFEFRDDVEILRHKGSKELGRTDSGRNVSEHKACGACRKLMLENNQGCPWCRDEVVWKEVFGFLDSLKGQIGTAANADQLADLMAKWEVYELTRSRSDVIRFSKDMVEDVALGKQLERVTKSNSAWLRDSSGLWCRFHGMIVDGELEVGEVRREEGERRGE